jgi:ribosomal protein L20
MQERKEVNFEVIELRTEFNAHLKNYLDDRKRNDKELETIWRRMDENAQANHAEYLKLENKLDTVSQNINTKMDTNAKEQREDMKGFRILIITTLLSVVLGLGGLYLSGAISPVAQ